MPKIIKIERGKKPNIDLNKLDKESQKLNSEVEKNLRPLGMNGDKIIEPIPQFNRAGCEKLIQNGNSTIVLGRDRNASLKSGYMGARSTGCGSIDLVVGRASSHKPVGDSYGSSPGQKIMVDPNFYNDAARIYISQKADIDEYFGLAPVPLEDSKGRSGVGVKADHVRIVGRNSIKIVTGKGIAKGPLSGELNSQGGKIDGPGTISLIAGNYTEGNSVLKVPLFFDEPIETLQPIPKGDNLIDCLRDIIENLKSVSDMVMANTQGIIELAGAVDTHFHDYGGGFGPTTPSSVLALRIIPTYIMAITSMLDNLSFTYNNTIIDLNYLNDWSPKYINSRHVSTT
tara:strand:+ start:4201 stop:5226 length:1026 start_codon:yes stop_codon:yes gene_type:complete